MAGVLGAGSGTGENVRPSLIGFGAVLQNLSGLLDNIPLASTIAGATVAWLVIWSFLSGGVLDRFARDRPTRTAGFFAACGTHFWRFFRLGVIGWLVYAFLFGELHVWIFDSSTRGWFAISRSSAKPLPSAWVVTWCSARCCSPASWSSTSPE